MTQRLTDPNQLLDIGGNLAALFSTQEGALVFLATLLISIGLACAAVFMGGSGNSMTPQLQSVTDSIRTPVPAGQKQHGSAEWLPSTKYAKVFGSAVIDTKSEAMEHIISHGANDLDFTKPKATSASATANNHESEVEDK